METLKTIKRYEIHEMLGEGGMATVYKAYDPVINRDIALKILRKEFSNNHEFNFRFMREGKTAGSLLHSNIVTIYDIAEKNEEQPYIAMEYLDGKNLEQIMSDGNRLTIKEVIEIGIQLTNGLKYAHDRGVIHRDIKPSNIIFLKDTNKIKITDFGVAHIDNIIESEKTKTGMMLGTPSYMSPEQIKGVRIDRRSDLFSVGVVLYQLVTGNKPFKGNSIIEVYQHIIEGNFRSIYESDPSVHPRLIKIIERLINKDPGKRFQSGNELENALRDLLHNLYKEKKPLKILPISSIRTKWTAVMAGIIALIMLPGIVTIYSTQYNSMTSLAFKRGVSLGKLIAIENVEAVLLNDWIRIQKVVEKINEQETFNDLTIIDRTNTIRGSTNMDLIGQNSFELSDSQFVKKIGDTEIYKIMLSEKTASFYFETPILYQGKEMGSVRIGLEEDPIRQVANSTLTLMIIQTILMMAAVSFIGYLLTTRLSHPIEILKLALNKLAEGDLEYCIDEKRKDEFGELFTNFNQTLCYLKELHKDDKVSDVSSNQKNSTNNDDTFAKKEK